MQKKKPEILAPAGSVAGMKAAVAAGCDAIYIGGSRFGARAFADNPDEEDMLHVIAYCHLHGVKVYMTVNTLLKQRELEETLYAYLLPYYEAGLDAVIVQDVGVLRFVREHFPNLAVHASTQMTLTMGKSTRLLEKYHVNRIVPARELSLKELEKMRQDTSLELEVFVHGALCYCYSGQCLFSSMQGGRSGNRGRCAQPCRMTYRMEKKEDASYFLSPKELCNLSHIPQMIEAGIDSFKIEGRMKRPEYTACVVAMYRKYTDLYCALGKEKYMAYQESHRKEWEEDLRKLAEIYNRNGFTQGYLEGKSGVPGENYSGKKEEMLASRRPNHGGVKVGEVLSVDAHTVTYQTCLPVHAQDVVEFRNQKMQSQYEYTLGEDIAAHKKIRARYKKGCRIKPGDTVYRTKDARLLQEIRERYLEKEKKVSICGNFVARKNEPFVLTVEKDNITAVYQGDICQEAQNRSATVEEVRKSLMQTGNSMFSFTSLEICLDEGLFLPVGALKKARREVLSLLEQNILMQSQRDDALDTVVERNCTNKASVKMQTEKVVSVMRREQLTPVLKDPLVCEVYLATECMTKTEIIEAFEQIKQAGKKAGLLLPYIFRNAVWDMWERNWQEACAFDHYLIRNMESFVFLREKGIEAEKIVTDYNLYIMNTEAERFWKEQGTKEFVLPLEMSYQECCTFAGNEDAMLVVYGHIPLMVSAQCLRRNTQGCQKGTRYGQNTVLEFKDEKGRDFQAVNYCRYCYNIIYRKTPFSLLNEKEKVSSLGILHLCYHFTIETPEEIQEILNGRNCGKTQTGHFDTGME